MQNLLRCNVPILHVVFVVIGIALFSVVVFAEGPMEKADTPVTQAKEDAWTGIDVSIVGKYAEKYGRPPRDPYINTDNGDLLLFVFTVSGVVGGFVIGFNARKLFYEQREEDKKHETLNTKL